MKKELKKILYKILKPLIIMECAISKKLVSVAYRHLMQLEWGNYSGTNPEFFDHEMDLYYQWRATRNALWVERGAFGSLALNGSGRALELACGDGFNACNFYSLRCSSILACDFDVDALSIAKGKNAAKNIEYIYCDIRKVLPGLHREFDNIIWDAAIEHFTQDEIPKIMHEIKDRLKVDGVLSGYTLVEKETGQKHIHQHEYEFKSKEDLLRFLKPHFAHVSVFETIYPNRHNLYFWASDGVIPFSNQWPSISRVNGN